MGLKIERGFKIPEKRNRSNKKYEFEKIKKGESFIVPIKEAEKLRSALAQFLRRGSMPSTLFTSRTIRDEKGVVGVRFWRVE